MMANNFRKIVDRLMLKHPVSEIAEKLGVSKGNVSKYYNNKLQPSRPFLLEFCKAYNIEPNEVFNEIEAESSPARNEPDIVSLQRDLIEQQKETLQLQRDKIKLLEEQIKVCEEVSKRTSTRVT